PRGSGNAYIERQRGRSRVGLLGFVVAAGALLDDESFCMNVLHMSRIVTAIAVSTFLSTILCPANAQGPSVHVTGELKRWHKVILTLDGPTTSAVANPNPFLDLRMDVIFEHALTRTTFKVPGYFDADG